VLYLKNLTLALDYSFSHLKTLCVKSKKDLKLPEFESSRNYWN